MIIVAVKKDVTLHINQVPAMPITPTWSRIFAISLAVRTPLLAARYSSKAIDASPRLGNSDLEQRGERELGQNRKDLRVA